MGSLLMFTVNLSLEFVVADVTWWWNTWAGNQTIEGLNPDPSTVLFLSKTFKVTLLQGGLILFIIFLRK